MPHAQTIRLFRADTFRRTLFVLSLPVFELVFFRWYLHAVLGLRIGWPVGSDYDLAVPFLFAGILFFQGLQTAEELTPLFSRRFGLFNLLSVIAFALINHNFDLLDIHLGALFSPFWWGSLFSIPFTAIFTFVSPKYFLQNLNRLSIFPCVLIAFSLIIYNECFDSLWQQLGPIVGQTTFAILKLLWGGSVSNNFDTGRMLIFSGGFRVAIARGCGGIDALFLFANLFLVLRVVSQRGIGLFRSASWFLCGGLFFFFLNVIRIVLVYSVGLYLFRTFGYETSRSVTLLLFHTHIGWVLYVVGAIFFSWSYLNFAGTEAGLRRSLITAQ